MKKIASLLLLPLLLAACGTQSAAPATESPNAIVAAGQTVFTGPTYVQAFEAGVQRDLTAAGLSGSVGAQALAPKSYLNVLKVNESTARAYVKTTYPTATGCTLNWGDGTATAAITTPSVVATDKADHVYTQSGTYTIRLTCGTDIKTSTFTAIVPVTNLNLFDDFLSDQWYQYGNQNHQELYIGSKYSTQGLDFLSLNTFMVRKGPLAPNHNAILLSCDGTVRTTSGAPFNIKSLTGGSFLYGVEATAYSSDGTIIGSTVFSNEFFYAGAPVETRTLNWQNVKNIRITCPFNSGYLVIDDMSAAIQPSPK